MHGTHCIKGRLTAAILKVEAMRLLHARDLGLCWVNIKVVIYFVHHLMRLACCIVAGKG
jgi:hypothetical protein